MKNIRIAQVAVITATLLIASLGAVADARTLTHEQFGIQIQPADIYTRVCDRIEARLPGIILPHFCRVAPPPVVLPTVDLSVNDTSVMSGESVMLSWVSSDALSCAASGGWSGAKSLSGSQMVVVTATSTYTLTCQNAAGSASDSVTVNVIPPPPAPTLSFSGSPLEVLVGATSTLSWTSTNANTCLASNGWSGNKSLSGQEIVTVNATTTYALACGNGTATSTQSVTLNAHPVPPPPTPSLSFSASPLMVFVDATSTLSWNSSNANACAASGGWSGSKSLSGNEIVTVNATTTYTLACGNGSATTSQSVTVNAKPKPAPTLSLSASPNSVMAGATSTLMWTSMNAAACQASDGWSGSKGLSGSEIVTVNATTTYSLSCGNGMATSTQSVTVGAILPPPTLLFSANPTHILSGATSTLTWSSMHTSSCLASDGWSGTRPLSGSEVVSPTATTTYTLSCFGNNATTSASVMVGVSSSTPPINHIVISEVHYDTDAQHGSEPANEWIELYNGTGSDVNVGGWFIGDAASTSADMLPPGTMIADGGFLVITASSTTASFWSIPAESHVVVLPNSIGGNGLANTGDAVFLSNGVSFVDAVSYGTNTDAFSPSVADVASGHSIARTDPSVDTNTASDWADMTTPTPGSE